MSYPEIPFEPSEEAVSDLLFDIASRKEYYIFKPVEEREYYDVRGFITPSSMEKYLTAPGLQLSAAQLFIRNFQNPNTEFSRILINWQTGVGKSIAAISIGNEFIRQYRIRALLGEELSTVFIISFTAKETIKEDMLKYPEFGFVSKNEVEELKRMRQDISKNTNLSPEAKALSNMYSILGRRITDKNRGGNYQFYGYKEFANRLFIITQKGVKEKFDMQSLFMPSKITEDETFIEIIDAAIREGYVIINDDLLNTLKNGLIIADEIHNVYNILEKNNYGIAIQYVLNILGDNAPRAVFMSATPMTGSASEIVDLLNLLVPISYLKKELKRGDFFYKTTKHIDFKTYKIIEFNNQKLIQGEDIEKEDIEKEDIEKEEYGIDENIINNNITTAFSVSKKLSLISISDMEENIESNIDNSFLVSELKPDAREKISQLSAGRVSFLLDTDVNLYPKKIFLGEKYDYIPYLKITKCIMPEIHINTIEFEHNNSNIKKTTSSGFSPNAYSLYDFVFPNPDNKNIGLYKSIETPIKLLQAPEKWKTENGVFIEYGHNMGLLNNSLIPSGPFLHKDNISKYSTKYYLLLLAIIKAVKSGPGKIMVYHHRVKMTGVLLLSEMLKMNGFIQGDTAEPNGNTRCTICGIKKNEHNKEHNKEHKFIPARFIVAHSDIDRPTMIKNIHQFNSINNLQGYEYRIILGSKIIREGLNFRAVRYQFISSFPTDYPTLLQVIGRVVRKGSHEDLPESDRNVKIEIFINTRKDEQPSPEMQRYINKGKEYLIIQEVEKSLRVYAVDAFANYSKIKQILPLLSNGEPVPCLETIPYKPIAIKEIDPSKLNISTFNAYGYSEREVYVIMFILRILFNSRPIWIYSDLWNAVKTGQVKGVNYNHTLFDEGNFTIALHLLSRPSGSPPKIVTEVGKYFIQSEIKQNKESSIDIEFFIRENIHIKPANRIKISSYLSKNMTNSNFNIYLKIYINKYLSGPKLDPIELSLIDFNSIFHVTFIKYLITKDKAISELSEADYKTIINLYKRFKIILTAKNLPASMIKNTNFIMGYKDKDSIYLYFGNNNWKNISHMEYMIDANTKENNIIIGFVSDDKGIYTKFKTRPPIQNITIANDKKNDIRSLAKGAICNTRFKEDLFVQIQELKTYIKKIEKNSLKSKKNIEETKYPSANILCNILKIYLLILEENSRNNNGVKWLYLFDDKMPNIQLRN